MDMRMRMERTVWIACIVSGPIQRKKPEQQHRRAIAL